MMKNNNQRTIANYVEKLSIKKLDRNHVSVENYVEIKQSDF